MSEEKNSFEEKCAERIGEIAGRGKLRYIVCVDGSEASEQAFNVTMSMKRKYDFIAVYHAAKDHGESFVQPNWRPAAIQQHYEVELVARMPSDRFATIIENRGDKPFMETLNHALSQYEDSMLLRELGHHYPDFIVFGYVCTYFYIEVG